MWNKLVVFLFFCLLRIKFDYTLYCKLWFLLIISLKVLVPQSCLNLCDPMDCSPPGSSVHGGSLGKNTGVGCQALLQAILPTQGSNPCLLNCRQILYHFSHQGSISPLIYYQLNFSQQYFVVFSV